MSFLNEVTDRTKLPSINVLNKPDGYKLKVLNKLLKAPLSHQIVLFSTFLFHHTSSDSKQYIQKKAKLKIMTLNSVHYNSTDQEKSLTC